ncbi:MAG: NAD(P)/FAD-dependent oxidoreductase [Alphaproteobacteria bacterium]|nr:NAD(P)/FAD-dependent oxidoreductase [Alphaproteobacteria bacterium]
MAALMPRSERPLRIAVIGTGIAGLSAAWLLAQRHDVQVFEKDTRIGGHCNTVDADGVPVDTGFIVYNETTYPNLTALFRHLEVPTKPSDMSFAVSLDDGRLEYAGTDLFGLFAQPRNLVRPRFWAMLYDLRRFYRNAPRDVAALGLAGLDEYLAAGGYGAALRDDHLYPMAAAIWSTPVAEIGRYPAAAFIRFCDNHGLLRLRDRPVWRTVDGGSREYVARLTRSFAGRIAAGRAASRIRRAAAGVEIVDALGHAATFDHAVIATHADQALALLADPSEEERALLGAFGYNENMAVLHRDPALMPRRRAAWASWNYISRQVGASRHLSVTYWMNRLQDIPDETPLFVTLNPEREPDPSRVIRADIYHHPRYDAGAMVAQERLWSLQGQRNTWFCGAHFGAGFHEDGLQSGLAVAEQLGGVRRPWSVPDESSRIFIAPTAALSPAFEPAP